MYQPFDSVLARALQRMNKYAGGLPQSAKYALLLHKGRYAAVNPARPVSLSKAVFLMVDKSLATFAGYDDLLLEIKRRIQTAQVRAALAVNRELVLLYWQIGRDILTRQQEQGWGARVIDRLAADLKNAFPEMKGFSRTNLLYMRAFADAYPEEAFVQQVVGQMPWGHNIRILDFVKDADEREWYIRSTQEHGWSRNVLVLQIES